MSSNRSAQDELLISAFIVAVVLIGGIAYGLYLILIGVLKLLALVIVCTLILIAVYLVVFLLSVIVAAGSDVFGKKGFQNRQKVRFTASVKGSVFPLHSCLQNPNTADGYFWKMIDYYIGDQTVAIQRSSRPPWIGKADFHTRQTEDISQKTMLRMALLADEKSFRRWLDLHIFDVFFNPKTKFILRDIYNRIWKRFIYESQDPQNRATEVYDVILRKIYSQPRRDFFKLAKMTLNVFSGGRFQKLARSSSENVMIQELVHQEIKVSQRVQVYLADAEEFRLFMDRFFFEIMSEMGPFHFDFSQEIEKVCRQQEKEKHYFLPDKPKELLGIESPEVNAKRSFFERLKRKLLPAPKPDSERQAAPQTNDGDKVSALDNSLKIHEETARQLAEMKMKSAQKENQKQEEELISLREQFGELDIGVLFIQYQRNLCPFSDDIRQIAIERAGDDASIEKEILGGLQRSKRKFRHFWEENELEILRHHFDRRKVEKAQAELAKGGDYDKDVSEDVKQKRLQSIFDIFYSRYRSKDKVPLLKGHLEERYGYLISSVYIKMGNEGKFGSEIFKSEVREILDHPDWELQFCSPECTLAVQNANLHQEERLTFSDAVPFSPAETYAELYAHILEFHEHQQQWSDCHEVI